MLSTCTHYLVYVGVNGYHPLQQWRGIVYILRTYWIYFSRIFKNRKMSVLEILSNVSVWIIRENNILYILILFADSIEQTDRSRRIMTSPIMLLLDQLVTPLIIGLKDRGEFRISTRLETTESIIIQMAWGYKITSVNQPC